MDSWVNVLPEQLTSPDGSFSNLKSDDEGRTWTATFAPKAGVTNANSVITLDSAVNGGASSSAFTVDTVRPSVSISMVDKQLTTGETTTVTISFSEKVTGMSDGRVSAPYGSLSPFLTSDGGQTWTATFTPEDAFKSEYNAKLILNNINGITDLAGNTVGTINSSGGYYSVDTTGPAPGPTATVSVDDSALKLNETAGVTITFSQAVRNFDGDDITVGSGTLSNLSSSDEGLTWHGTLTPADGVETSGNVVSVNLAGVTGYTSGVAGTGSATSNTYKVDTKLPTATIVVADTALKANETSLVTITFSEAVQGLTKEDFQVEGGTLSDPVATDEGIGVTWSATFTPTAGVEGSGKHITLDYSGVADLAGNAGTGSKQSNAYAVDTLAPTATLRIDDPNLTKGETTTVTVTFSEKITGLSTNNVNMANGSLSALATSDEGMTWTATFTPNDNHKSEFNPLSLNGNGIYDLAGNAFSHVTSNLGYYAIDTTTPVAPTATVLVDAAALKLNQTAGVTITFSEAVRDFDINDVTVGSGTLSNLSSSDEGRTWHATLNPAAGVEDLSNVVSVDLSGVTGYVSGAAGTGNAVSLNYRVDTKAPTATIVVADNVLTEGETSLVTITFSEHVSGFNPLGLIAQNGNLGTLSTPDEGRTWTTTFTPDADVNAGDNVITLNLAGLIDAAGNGGTGVVRSNQYTVDTAVPVPVPPTETVLVDGMPVEKTTGSAADGSTTQIVTVPVVTTGRVNENGTAALADIPLVSAANGDTLLSVGLPVGFGLQASGSGTAASAGQSLTNLIAEIKAHSQFGSQSQNAMVDGGTGFLGKLDASTPLLVQTVVLSAATGASASENPLVIRSAPTGNGAAHTALVVDGTALPNGTVIELQDVSFAAVTGNVKLVGGNGSQTIFGDGGSQNIFLGEDDDILHGGAGDDIVGSAGGNDQIFGDEGNDVVFGGQGNDRIDGGSGIDTVRLMGASRAEYTMRIKDGAVVMTHLKPDADGTDIVANVELLQYAGQAGTVDFNQSEIAGLVRMYSTAFGRTADTGGINFWIEAHEKGFSMMQIADFFMASDEGKANFGTLSNHDFVAELYDVAMHRVASEAEVDFWTSHLDRGALDRGDVLYYFATSEEKADLVGVVSTSITTV